MQFDTGTLVSQTCEDYNNPKVMQIALKHGPFKFAKPAAKQSQRVVKKCLAMIDESGARYEGEVLEQNPAIRHGRGVLIWPDGTRYEGQFLNGYQQGYGRLIEANQDFYEGNWLKNMRHGSGDYIPLTGVKYSGNWIANQKHEQGREDFPDGAVF